MVKTESLLKELFENPKNIVLVTDENYSIRYISDTVETIFGIRPYSLLGKNAFDFVSSEKRADWSKCLNEAKGNKTDEICLKAADGRKIYFDVTVTNHVSNESIKGLVIFLHDITDQRLTQLELENANHHLDHFIFKTTHDLRAPLHSALGLVNLAENSEGKERDKYIGLIKTSLQKLDSFIEEVNSFYKNDKLAVSREVIDLETLFRVELDYLRNLPGAEGIQIDFILNSKTDLYSDSIRLKTIVTNILSNSIKYSDQRKHNRFIRLDAEVETDHCTVTITDNGVGIDGRYLDKIFDIFYRANTETQGTGLGLYIVKDTVERLQGKIEVQSKLGKGTVFTITLPNFVAEPAVLR